MKKMIIILFLLMPLTALASGKGSFMDISFGTPHSEVLKMLGGQKDKAYSIEDHKSSVTINNYTLGNEKLTVLLLFDHNDRLYSFEYHSRPRSAAQFSEVKKQADNINAVFRGEYGKPAGCYKAPLSSQLTEGRVYLSCDWDDKYLAVFTGYRVGREECPSPDNVCYYSVGSVTSEEMARALNEDMNKNRRRRRRK